MTPMERSTASKQPASESSHADAAETGATKKVKAHGDRNFEQVILPSLGSGPIFPFSWLIGLFRRKDTPTAR